MLIFIYTDSRGRYDSNYSRSSWANMIEKKYTSLGNEVICSIRKYIICSLVNLERCIVDCDILIIQSGFHDHIFPYSLPVWRAQNGSHALYESGKYIRALSRDGIPIYWYDNEKMYESLINNIKIKSRHIIWIPMHFFLDKAIKCFKMQYKNSRISHIRKDRFLKRFSKMHLYETLFDCVKIPTTKKWRNKFVGNDWIHYNMMGHKKYSRW